MDTPLHILCIALSVDMETNCREMIRSEGYSFEHVAAGAIVSVPQALSSRRWDAIFCNYHLGESDCLPLLKDLREKGFHGALIVLSPESGEERAVQAIKAGADEFLSPERWKILGTVVQREIAGAASREQRERLRQEKERKSRVEAFARIARHIAHDFNNLITVLLGNLTLLRSTPFLHAEGETYVLPVEKACRRAGTLTQNLFAISRGIGLQAEPFSLQDIIRELSQSEFIKAPWVLSVDVPQKEMEIVADRKQILVVLRQLLTNAVQSMPNGGKILLVARIHEITHDCSLPLAPGSYVQVEIIDEGTGISPETAGRIFEPFFSTKRDAEGLGLCLANTILQKHGGHLTFDSTPGSGTRFSFLIPTLQVARTHQTGQKISPSNTNRILVMDDESSIRDLLGMALREIGYDVALAGDGEEAIRLSRQAQQDKHPFFVAILDLSIPGGMGGSETLRELRALDPSIRAIVSSGYADHLILDEFRKEGFDGAIGKPYDLDEMFRLIEQVKETPHRN